VAEENSFFVCGLLVWVWFSEGFTADTTSCGWIVSQWTAVLPDQHLLAALLSLLSGLPIQQAEARRQRCQN